MNLSRHRQIYKPNKYINLDKYLLFIYLRETLVRFALRHVCCCGIRYAAFLFRANGVAIRSDMQFNIIKY